MIFWYESLYMDDDVSKDVGKCKKIIQKRYARRYKSIKRMASVCMQWHIFPLHGMPWQKNYELVLLAANKKNLFEIINTAQLFFSFYGNTDMYIVGVSGTYEGAVEIVRGIMEKGYRENEAFDPRRIFTEGTFTPLDGTGG